MFLAGAAPVVVTRDGRDPASIAALPVDLDDLAELLAGVLAAEGAPASAEASLQIVSPGEIAALNAEHLGVEGPTDVLSFPLDGVGPVVDPVGGRIVGDVVVCAEVAVAQAPGHAGDLEGELALLVVHGGLHLCGWDHRDSDEQTRMWDRERELLDRAGRRPARDPWGPR